MKDCLVVGTSTSQPPFFPAFGGAFIAFFMTIKCLQISTWIEKSNFLRNSSRQAVKYVSMHDVAPFEIQLITPTTLGNFVQAQMQVIIIYSPKNNPINEIHRTLKESS